MANELNPSVDLSSVESSLSGVTGDLVTALANLTTIINNFPTTIELAEIVGAAGFLNGSGFSTSLFNQVSLADQDVYQRNGSGVVGVQAVEKGTPATPSIVSVHDGTAIAANQIAYGILGQEESQIIACHPCHVADSLTVHATTVSGANLDIHTWWIPAPVLGIYAAYPGESMWTWQQNPDQNNGGGTEIQIAQQTANKRNGYLKWDLTNIPQNATVNSATLYLFSEFGHTGSLRHWLMGKLGVSDTWSESVDTWNTMGAASFSTGVNFHNDDLPDLVDSTDPFTKDITTIVQDWIDNPANNNGIVIYCNQTASESGIDIFNGNVTNGASRARIDIDYTTVE